MSWWQAGSASPITLPSALAPSLRLAAASCMTFRRERSGPVIRPSRLARPCARSPRWRSLRNRRRGNRTMADTALATLETVDILGVMKLLPHRYPFLLVDRIVEIDRDNSAIGIKNVTFNEPHFQGHFPG